MLLPGGCRQRVFKNQIYVQAHTRANGAKTLPGIAKPPKPAAGRKLTARLKRWPGCCARCGCNSAGGEALGALR